MYGTGLKTKTFQWSRTGSSESKGHERERIVYLIDGAGKTGFPHEKNKVGLLS